LDCPSEGRSTAEAEDRANTILKAVTKAKRRVTLSICGLGFLDETEVEDIPAAAKRDVTDIHGLTADNSDPGVNPPALAPTPRQKPSRKPQTIVPAPKQRLEDDLAAARAAEVRAEQNVIAKANDTRRERRLNAERKIDARYEAEIRSGQPRRDKPAQDDPDAERTAWEAEERAQEFIRLEHEIQSAPSIAAMERWSADNHARIAKFTHGELNALRTAYATRKASLQPHSISQKAMAARGPRYASPVPPDDGLDIPASLRRSPLRQSAETDHD
jgi:hypothetical protein